MLERVVDGCISVMGWTMTLLESTILLTCRSRTAEILTHVKSAKDSISWNHVVPWCWLKVVKMRETGSVSHSHKEWHEGVAIIDSIAFSAVQELKDIMFDDRVLGLCTNSRPRSFSGDCISESKDIFISFVLKGVLVYINHSILISESRFHDKVMRLTRWIYGSSIEFFFYSSSSINILESSNFLSNIIVFH